MNTKTVTRHHDYPGGPDYQGSTLATVTIDDQPWFLFPELRRALKLSRFTNWASIMGTPFRSISYTEHGYTYRADIVDVVSARCLANATKNKEAARTFLDWVNATYPEHAIN